MTRPPTDELAPARGWADDAEDQTPPPGRQAVVIAALAVGILLLGVQLWLLTVALDLYLSGDGAVVWSLALVSGVVFFGGLLALRLLGRRPRVSR